MNMSWLTQNFIKIISLIIENYKKSIKNKSIKNQTSWWWTYFTYQKEYSWLMYWIRKIPTILNKVSIIYSVIILWLWLPVIYILKYSVFFCIFIFLYTVNRISIRSASISTYSTFYFSKLRQDGTINTSFSQ